MTTNNLETLNRITIEVSGGMVQSVYTTMTGTEIEVDILDFDCHDNGEERKDKEDYLRRVASEQSQIY